MDTHILNQQSIYCQCNQKELEEYPHNNWITQENNVIAEISIIVPQSLRKYENHEQNMKNSLIFFVLIPWEEKFCTFKFFS